MGNQLSGSAPSQILPLENYLAELNSRNNSKELIYKKNLGSTRFLKVVLCGSSGRGKEVAKIFIIPDSTLPLNEHRKKIQDIIIKLYSAINCLPFKRVEMTERAVFIIRPYVKHNLYDRMSTRPFLSSIEKKWLAFQFLCGLNQCHQKEICHGDIKEQNILITSWLLLELTDFASFKPVLLPEDNPTDFTYYFDTSRRRVCHIAPERFIKTIHDDEAGLKEVPEVDAELTPAMDIFSAGCVLIVLFTDGIIPFNLTKLLHYRADSYYPTDALDKITDQRARNMVEEMIKKNPAERRSAAEYLDEERGKLFPEYFYSFLMPFLKQFAVSGEIADKRIENIYESFSDVLLALEIKERITASKNLEENQSTDVNESLILIISVITSCVRSLYFPSSKILTMKLFRMFSIYVSNEVILDRILPYILHFLKDGEPKIRSEALHTLSQCLIRVDAVPRSETNIFLEYILPHLNEVSNEKTSSVRQEDARNIANIADTAMKFVAYCLNHYENYVFKNEMLTLQEVVQQKLAKLFSDSSNIVKRSLIEENLDKLCLFFGKEKAGDILLSHLITFLNEKKDFHLRLSFYSRITSIANFMGASCHQMLLPFFQQGLSDTEEWVIGCAVDNMSDLTELGIFPDYILIMLIAETAPLLIHPNQWIRQAVVRFITTVSKLIEFIDVLTTIRVAVEPFTKKKFWQLDNEMCILSYLTQPLPRGVYDVLIKCHDVSQLLDLLQDGSVSKKQHWRLISNSLGDQSQLKSVFKRLLAAGFTETMVGPVLSMKDHLIKVQRHRKGLETIRNSGDNEQLGFVKLDFKTDQGNFLHKCRLAVNESSMEHSSNLSSSSQSLQKSSSLTMNEEWQTMFGNVAADDEQRSGSSTLASSRQSSSLGVSLASQCFILDQSKEAPKYVSACQRELEHLLYTKREEMQGSSQGKTAAASSDNLPCSHKWRPKGHLVAHLHEHKASVTRLVALTGTSLYASSSKDGTVKIWDCNKTERTPPVNRSKYTYNQQKGVILTIAYCSRQESIASSSDNRSIHVINVDKQNILTSRQLSKEDGYAYNMNYMNAGSHSLLTYSTVYGKIYGWDLRAPGNAWVIDNDLKKGVITTYAIHDSNTWLACGTTSGNVVCWDLRFMVSVSEVKHSRNYQVQRLILHPTEPSWVIASIRANNEVVFWNMETQSRPKTLWASPNPPLSGKARTATGALTVDNWVTGLCGGRTETGSSYLFTVGTDSRIRYWDCDSPELSYVVSPSANCAIQSNTSFGSRRIEDSEVIVEKTSVQNLTTSEESPEFRRAPDQPPTGHIETITDIIMLQQPQTMLATSEFSGAIKMWK